MKSRTFLPIIYIFGLTFLVWHTILGQYFLGEAYMYFPETQNFFTNNMQISTILTRYNNFALIMFDIFPPIFKDNIQLYLLLQLIITSVLGSTLYWVIYKLTKNKIIGFSAAVFFITNYTGSFEMMATGTYQRFAERTTSVVPMLFSLYFLSEYYNKNKYSKLFISISLFTLGIILAHYSTFLLPFFIVFPVAQFIYSKKTNISFIKNFLIVLCFVFINFLITKNSNQSPNGGILDFFIQEKNIIERLFLQIPVVTIPPNIIKFISRFYFYPLQYPYIPILKILLIPSAALYLYGLYVVRKQNKNIKILYFTAFFGMILEMFIYMFVDRRLNVLINIGESRFFYITSLFASINWAIIIFGIFSKNIKKYKVASFFILLIYLLYNYNVITKNVEEIQYKSEMMKRYVTYVKQLSTQFNKDSVVIVPVHIMWPNPMIQLYYGYPEMTITRTFDGWEEEFRNNKDNVFVIDYDYEKSDKGEFDSQKGHVVDLTAKYRMGQKIIFSE